MGTCCAKAGALVEEQSLRTPRSQQIARECPSSTDVKVDAGADLKLFTEMDSLIDILRTGAIRLVTAEFIVRQYRETAEPMPCRQDLPEEAFLHVEDLEPEELAELRVFVLSYCWVTADHPDPQRYHLETVALLLEVYLRCPRDAGEPDEEASFLRRQGHDLGGLGRRVAAFWDWTALPQDKPAGRRTAEELQVFKRGLKSVNTWYGHAETTVLALTSLPPEAARPSYEESGWTAFERAVAGILTPAPRLLVLDEEARRRLAELQRPEAGACEPDAFLGLEDGLKDTARGAPRAPEAFEALVRGKQVTNGADVEEVLVPRYQETFQASVQEAAALELGSCGLGAEAGAEVLRVAHAHCRRLRRLNLSNNREMRLHLVEVTASCRGLTELDLSFTGVHGDVAGLAELGALTHLDLSSTGVQGDVASLSELGALTYLGLRRTRVQGDVAGLSELGALTHLNLSSTRVQGDVAVLSKLRALTFLDLGSTGVQGDVASLAELGALTDLTLSWTRVQGDVAGLSELVALTYLDLCATEVQGDVAGLSKLGALTWLDLSETKVRGQVSSLAGLKALVGLVLDDTGVEGDAQGLREALREARAST